MDMKAFLAKHQLPLSYQQQCEQFFIPLAQQINQAKQANSPLFVAINGCQGSGKTTLADFLVAWFTQHSAFNCVALSIDDFYLSKLRREQLAKTVHPLLVTRGVPGTHDVPLMRSTIAQLLAGNSKVPLPYFHKHLDDCALPAQWPTNEAPVDIVILEGWCVGSKPQSPAALAAPLNALEEQDDPQGVWRHYVNQCLKTEYLDLFAQFNYFVMLKAPSFSSVFNWRKQQEQKLVARNGIHAGTMDDPQLQRFIAHFERITRNNLIALPQQANALLELTEQRAISKLSFK
jgi:D-glycerate 3-kinase